MHVRRAHAFVPWRRNRSMPDAARVRKRSRLIRAGPSGPTGRPHYFGFEPTSAAGVGGWDRWIIPVHRNSPDSLTFATQAYRHLVLDEPSWTVDMFEQRDLAFASERESRGGAGWRRLL